MAVAECFFSHFNFQFIGILGKCRDGGIKMIASKFLCPAGTYIATGFSALQSVVDLMFIQVKLPSEMDFLNILTNKDGFS